MALRPRVLRHRKDHLFYGVGLKYALPASELDGRSDPLDSFCESESELDDMIRRRNFDAVSPAAIDLVRRLKPYKGGNTPIRYVHDLDVMDKHQMLFPGASTTKTPSG